MTHLPQITRRDFLDGVLVGAGAILAGGWLAACDPASTIPGSAGVGVSGEGLAPSLRTGLVGQSSAAAEVPHQLRDGTFWASAPGTESTGETYDLVVVGAGISGLASAYFFEQAKPGARILILEADLDIGGHARRNEFTGVRGRPGGLLVGYGGSEALQSPALYSDVAKRLLDDLGIQPERFRRYYQGGFYPSRAAYVFGEEHWGRDHVAFRGSGQRPYEILSDAPMASRAKRDLEMLYDDPPDWMPGLSDAEKKLRLAELSYADFLSDVARVHPDAQAFLYNLGSDGWGFGIDAQGAIDVWTYHPGFTGMGMDASEPSPYNSPSTTSLWYDDEPYIFHFPGGNSTIARLLLRSMIPAALPGHSAQDEVLATLDYGRLDTPGSRVRVRLGSPVVGVENLEDGGSEGVVEVSYADGGFVRSVRASSVIMAGMYAMVPYIVRDYPDDQAAAARMMSRVPLVYTSVLLRTRRAFRELDCWGGHVVGRGTDWTDFYLDYPVSIGRYEYPIDLDEPGIVLVHGAPTVPGLPPRDGAIAGRTVMAETPFADYEASLRGLLQQVLGPGGFDDERDIQAITVNRWAHGYTWEYSLPWDKDFYPHGPLPGRVASRRLGRIAFANTDRLGAAYADRAIDAAHEAVVDLGEQG